jgi:hypothetical protein
MNPTQGNVTVSVVRDRASLAGVVVAWEDLARHAIEPNPLYEPWMLLPALEAQGSEDFVCVLTWS